MREITFEQSKKIEMDILLDIVRFCEGKGFRYCLAYGTLIGAVRHQGFIPWDDDIDIHMPRLDYDEFLRTYNAEDKPYKVIDPKTDIARHSFAKVIDTRTVKIEPMIDCKEPLGIDVDIFPLDGMPEDADTYEKWYDELYKTYQKYTLKCLKIGYYPRFTTRLKLRLKRLFYPSRKKLLEKAKKLHEKYPYETSAFVGCIESYFNGRGNRAQKSDYEDTVLVDFENYQFKAPVGYDRILRNLYGDYMQLPPEDKRVTHHTNKTYWRD